MKKTLFLFLLFSGAVLGQSQNENYIKTVKHKQGGNSSFKDLNPDNTVVVDITYFDGLGRPKQQIAHRQSGTGGDLVTHIEYDGLGRQVKNYLPYERYAHTSLPFDANAHSNTLDFYSTPYFQNTQNPFSETQFDNSPLGRVLKRAAPGNEWAMGNGKEIKMDHQTNAANEVLYFRVNTPSSPTLALNTGNNGRYPANQLYKTVIKDENWQGNQGIRGTVVEYKNKLGQVVLKRIYTSASGRTVDMGDVVPFDTYYVYDNHGNLTFVLPPKLSQKIVTNGSLAGNHQQLLSELGYRYGYDHRNRLIQKKLPGKQWEYIAYDALDRVIAVGPVPSPFMDGTQGGFIRTKYDHFNRVAYTLWRPGAFDLAERQALEAPQVHISETRTAQATMIDGIAVFYTNDVNPNGSDKLLTVNYYDDYAFPGAPSTIPSNVGQNNEIPVYYDNNTKKPKGMPTGSWARVLENATDQNATVSYILYDVKSRPVRARSTNYLGGFTQTDTQYDFIGKVLSSYTTHKKTAASNVVEVKEGFAYTPQDRLQKHLHRVNGNTQQMLSFNEYDPLGQLVVKKTGGLSESSGNYFQKVDFKYNIRGWLTDINNVNTLTESGAPLDLFAFKINYTSVTNTVNGNVKPLYNGNIAETHWRTASDNIKRRYGYTYDHTNRLLDAWYSIPGSAVNNSYNEHLTYDSNGNILTLQRFGEEEDASLTMMIDDLVYEYDDGNKLINVTDLEASPYGFNDGNISTNNDLNPNDFEYDIYGNLVMDRNKNILSITYNHLHLPKTIWIGSMNKIDYIYDANGVKLKKVATDNNTSPMIQATHYLDGFQYKGEEMVFFPHAEGYVNVTHIDETIFHYVYTYKDHLDNIRLRYTVDPETDDLAILEEDHYYPFGLKHNGYNGDHKIVAKEDGVVVLVPVTNVFEQENFFYKFGGMEYQNEMGLDVYDFGARNYDPAIGRWMNIDPLAEMMRRHSPYNFAFNNPMRFIDPDGMAPFDVVVTGDLADKAVSQLNASVEGQLTITRDEGSGQLSYERTGEGPLTKDAQQLVNAIDDRSVIVNVDANSSNVSTVTGNDIFGGEFQGSTTTTDGFGNSVTETKQQINPNQAEIIDRVIGEPGKVTLHEVVESHLGGVEAQNRGLESVPAATSADAGNPNSVYRTAHDNAPALPFVPTRFIDPQRNQFYIKTSRDYRRYFPGQIGE